MLQKFDERRTLIYEQLNSISSFSCGMPRGAFYAFPNIKKTGLSSEAAQDFFLTEAGVALIAGTSFGEYGEGYIRFSYANSSEKIIEAIDRIKKII